MNVRRQGVLLAVLLGLLIAASCVRPMPAPEATRRVASQDSAPALVYLAYDSENRHRAPEVIDLNRWQNEFKPKKRVEYLVKFYNADLMYPPKHDEPHEACFRGSAVEVARSFFNENDKNDSLSPKKLAVPKARYSSDRLMLGVSFDDPKTKHHYHFRLSECDAGKSPLLGEAAVVASAFIRRAIASATTPANPPAVPAATIQEGFKVLDTSFSPTAHPGLPVFSLKDDYNLAQSSPGMEDLPWRGAGLTNITTLKDAVSLALLLQKYFYEGMANQNSANPDMNFIAANDTRRYWCNMPWQNLGSYGREAVHGLTRERNLIPSPQMDEFKSPPAGTDWGVGYFNAPACTTVGAVFGTPTNAVSPPNFGNAVFPEGSVAAKILFTTGDFPAIHNSYTWQANVTGAGQSTRSVQAVRHMQLDISIKDSSLPGANAQLSNWTMVTFYYDESYNYDTEYKALLGGADNPLSTIDNLPPALLKMRPMGIQWGTGQTETLLFTNPLFPIGQTNGFQGRLNGPADNPQGSCMSCHATSGTTVAISPGFMSDADYLSNHDGSLDFSQQFALAKRNFETTE